MQDLVFVARVSYVFGRQLVKPSSGLLFRMPLSPMGVRIMKVVYFTIPIVGGWYIMQAANSYSDRNTAPLLRAKRDKELAGIRT